MKRMSWLFAAMACCLFPITASAAGATLYVDDDAPNDPGPADPFVSDPLEDGSPQHPFDTIQEAIDAAVPGDTVIVAEGTYHENIFFDGKDITLTSTNPEDAGVVARTVIDAAGMGRPVTFKGTETPACLLTGLKMVRGRTGFGGGIHGNRARATIAKCIILGNWAQFGGGAVSDHEGVIANCTIGYNSTDGWGGALYRCNGAVIGCSIRGNWGLRGGGLAICEGYISDSAMIDNQAGEYGGALYEGRGMMICDCTVTGNCASDGGAMICVSCTITRCTISLNCSHGGNAATGNSSTILMDSIVAQNYASGGGTLVGFNQVSNCTITGNTGSGVYNGAAVTGCTITANRAADGGGLKDCQRVTNCLIAGNWAEREGGGFSGGGNVTNCTIAGNATAGNGGGAKGFTSGPSITNCIIWGNTANGEGPNLYKTCSPQYSCIQGGDTSNWNINADPLFASPGHWQGDRWIEGDYHLKSQGGRWDPRAEQWVFDDVTSPCIDAGDPASPWGNEPYPNGGRINMGAYGNTREASKSFPNPDVNGDECVNVADLLIVRNNLGKGSPGSTASGLFNADVNRDGIVNVADLLIVRNNLGCGGGCR